MVIPISVQRLSGYLGHWNGNCILCQLFSDQCVTVFCPCVIPNAEDQIRFRYSSDAPVAQHKYRYQVTFMVT